MNNSIEINYISPVTNSVINKNKKYLLVFINTINKNIHINKIILHNITDVTEHIRGFKINESFKLFNNTSIINVFLFLYDDLKNTITSLFHNKFNCNDFEFNQKSFITLNSMQNITINYTNEKSVLDERFFKGNNDNSISKFIVFFSKLNYSSPTINTLISNINKFNDIIIFDRNSKCLIKEFLFYDNKESNLSKRHTFNIKNYLENKNKFDIEFKNIKRPIQINKYKNNVIINPCDGRIKKFLINDSLSFNIFNYKLDINMFLVKPFKSNNSPIININFFNGCSGFINRTTPQDYNKIYNPYGAYLTDSYQISITPNNRISNTFKYHVLKFETNYFISPDNYSRDYPAMITGNFIGHGSSIGVGSRYNTDKVKPQKDNYLIFYMIICNITDKDDVKKNNIKKNSYVEQGQLLAEFNNNPGYVITLFNKEISFSEDINNYDNILIKARSDIGDIF